MDMCRACMTTKCSLLKMDTVCLDNYNTLTNLCVKLDDCLPHYLCQSCWDNVDFCVNFRTKCISTESSLLTIANCKKVIKSEIHIKEENIIKIEQSLEIEDNEEFLFDDNNGEGDEECNIQFQMIYETTEGFNFVDDGDETKIRKSSRLTRKADKGIEAKVKKAKLTTKVVNSKLDKNIKLICGLCKNTYDDPSALQDHLEKHKRGNHCSICEDTYSEWAQLVVHRFQHIPSEKKKCHICWKVFKADYTLEYHYMTVHSDKEFTGIPCKLCNYKGQTPLKFRKHVWHAHSDKIHECPVCKKMYGTKYALKCHLLRHSDNKQYNCELCGYSCKYGGAMSAHMLRKHTKEKFSCKSCKRLFRNQQSLDKHVCGSIPRTSVLCPDCGKSFTRTALLYNHQRSVHTSDRPHKCDRCPATYKHKTSLRVHARQHAGIRNQQCEFCPLKFYTKAVLMKHRRTHTGEKPFVCKICKKGFTGNHNLKVHMKVHGMDLVVKKNVIKNEGDTTILN